MTVEKKKPSIEWFKGLEDKEAEEIEKILESNPLILRHFRNLLERRLRDIYENEVREDAFLSPSWAFKQAYINGKVSALQNINLLFNFLDHRN